MLLQPPPNRLPESGSLHPYRSGCARVTGGTWGDHWGRGLVRKDYGAGLLARPTGRSSLVQQGNGTAGKGTGHGAVRMLACAHGVGAPTPGPTTGGRASGEQKDGQPSAYRAPEGPLGRHRSAGVRPARGPVGRVLVAVLGAFGLLLALAVGAPSASAADPCGRPVVSVIACENSKPGNPASEWQISGAGSSTHPGLRDDDERQPR